MDVRGWVYVISNEAMPGLFKVGFSTKDPHLRAKELSTSGAPHPYVVAFDVLVRAPRDTEQRIHKELRDKREGKEWFRCTLHEAVTAVRSIAAGAVIAENMSEECEAKLSNGVARIDTPLRIPLARYSAPASPKWRLSESSGLLTHIASGNTFSAHQYYFEGGSGLVLLRSKEWPWIPSNEVEIVE
jgi:hypothetical protein